MTATLDDAIKAINDLTEVVKSNDRSTVDIGEITKAFEAKVSDLVAAQAKANEDRPDYRKASGEIAHNAAPVVEKSNRYHGIVKDIAAQGYHRVGTSKVRAIDFWLAHRLMTKSAEFAKNGLLSVETVNEPSNDLRAALKAMDTSTNANHIPTDMAAMLWDDIFLASRVAGAMQTVTMPTNPFDIPTGLGQPTWRKGTQNTATSQSNTSVGKATLTATELVTEQGWSYTLDEDSIIALMPSVRARLAQSGAEIIDDFALNADATNAATGNINLDDADPADDAYYLTDGADGVRHLWLVDNTAQGVNAGGDALADADITALLVKMGKYAVNPDEVVMVCDVSTYLNGFLATGTGKPGEYVATIDKFGPSAIIATGQIAAYRGIPIVISASHRLTEADGKLSTTGSNNTLGSISAMNRRMWYAGFRRNILVEVDRDIQKRQIVMVTSMRPAVATWGTRSAATHTAGIRNILV